MDAVLAACDGDVGKLKAQIRSDAAWPQVRPGTHAESLRFEADGKTYDVKFFVRVPPGYTPAKCWPVLVLAHGKGGRGDRMLRSFQTLLGRQIDRYVVVSPTMPGPPGWKAGHYQQLAYLRPLAWARLRMNIDDDRVHLSGYSQGGHLTWQLSMFYPRLFAATCPLAGAPTAEGFPYTTTMYLQNLAHLPLWAVWGENDGPAGPKEGIVDFCRKADTRFKALRIRTWRGTELKGVGHGGAWPDGQELARFLAAGRRVLLPEKFHHFFHMPYHGRGYYVEALKFTRPPIDFSKPHRVTLPPGRAPTQAHIIQANIRRIQGRGFRIFAMRNASLNSLRIQPASVRTVRLYVLEGLFDLSKPVRVQYWTRAWRGRVGASAKCMLQHYAATRDATGLVCNEIDLDVGGRVTVRFR